MLIKQLFLAPFVFARLSFSLTAFLGKVIWGLYPTQIMASATLVLALLITIAYLQASSLTQPLLPVIDTTRLRAETESWEKLAQQFPTHRDILLNTALLEYQLFQEDLARSYWQKAWEQDPNASFFITHPLGVHLTPLPSNTALSQN